ETMRRQKQFIADASHELKTPLAVIMANAEAMEHNPDPKWLHNIADESEKMNQLVVSMLDLARSEEEALVLEPVNLSLLAEKECLMQEAVVFEHNMILETEIEEDLWVKADKTKAAQLITILLDNAQKHAKSAIRVSLKREGKQAVLKVMNNGVPIPVEDREHIFERFYRGDKSRARASGRYGLGLAIAKNIALSHQSRIWADCSEGWTEFCWKIKLENGKSESQ
ncbi:MAG: HAMP domain-containing histidine kinase, partial [Erysipelotrichaceae bacterium]|nr:HAMP domain-containing histidine kinase [Erysipelotrichaceae bacterium]